MLRSLWSRKTVPGRLRPACPGHCGGSVTRACLRVVSSASSSTGASSTGMSYQAHQLPLQQRRCYHRAQAQHGQADTWSQSARLVTAAVSAGLAGSVWWLTRPHSIAQAQVQVQGQAAAGTAVDGAAAADSHLSDRHAQADAELRALFGDRYSKLIEDRETHRQDLNSYHVGQVPHAVVFPLTTAEVSSLVKVAARHRIPVIPYGSGTSLEGHTLASDFAICVDMSQMDSVQRVNVADMDCVVQPGITWQNLNKELKQHGLFFAVDPGPGASIGGMVATGCSGTNAVRYGTMRHNVVSLTVVLPDGSVIKTANRARKSSAGYDLTRLFIGSEGTLGIVTEVTVRLHPIPEQITVASCHFPSVTAAAHSVIQLLQKGVQVGCVELLDDVMMQAINEYAGLKYDLKPTLFFKFAGSPQKVKEDIMAATPILNAHGAGDLQIARDAAESDRIWEARKGALWASTVLRPGSQVWTTDVCVPISRLAECIELTQADLRQSFLPAPIVGHVGDGNFHVLLQIDPTSDRDREEAERVNKRMIERAIAMEGTCTGEHGVGVGKKKYLVAEHGQAAVDFMRHLKRSIDPLNIMNPGKLVDVEVSGDSADTESA